jgi:hypothetical protein
MSVTIKVTPKDDSTCEDTETVVVDLAPGTGYKVSGAFPSATVTIADND